MKMEARTQHPAETPALATVYDGGSVTLRVLRALGWGPELLNLGYFRFRGLLNVLNLIPSGSRLAATQKELVRQTVRALAPVRGDQVLDIACGRGFAAYYTVFVVACAVHVPVGLANIAHEWWGLHERAALWLSRAFGVLLLGMGLRAVYAVVA